MNEVQDTAVTMGIRAKGSSLDRKILVHEPESGGWSILDFLVKLDSNKQFEFYCSETSSAPFRVMGYFDSSLDFVELWQALSVTSTGWQSYAVGSYLDQNSRVCDFMVTHTEEANEETIGVRGGDSSADRYLVEHEAESAGAGGEYTGFSMSALSNSSGNVGGYYSSADYEGFYLTGYFKPAGGEPPATAALKTRHQVVMSG